MNKLFLTPVVASSIATCAFLVNSPLMPATTLAKSERAAIHAQVDDSLLSMRAGAAATSAGVSSAERDALARAQAADSALMNLRAGDLTQREWTIVGVVIVAVILIAIIA